jgi:aerobic-type carbon monoxide dehydrogenase small subunit (CoxS/CutS family)
MSKEKEENKSKRLSRRDFLKGAGAGAAAAALVSVGVEEFRISSMPKQAPPSPSPPSFEQSITLNVNGNQYDLSVDNRLSLLDALRDKLGFTGAKNGCDEKGECGACTVLVDEKPVRSCLILAVEAQGKKITTVEGLGDPLTGTLDPVQKSFLENDGLQCGYCTPGFIMLTKGILAENPHPTREQVMGYLGGQLCRCGSYPKIIESVLAASGAT